MGLKILALKIKVLWFFRCAEWVPLLSNPQLYGLTPQKIYKNYVVCSVHFDDDSFNNIRREHFNDNAIPKRHLIGKCSH